ncbi:MAG: hypothetical protein K5787_14840 [Lentisphaeria bacterium]|nr:hypothetical protein [Lentisphaeria bacterium]
MKQFWSTFHSSMTGWQPCLRSLVMLCVCFLNMALPYWHEHDVEEHSVNHIKCHAHTEKHLHQQPENLSSHDHERCAICQNAFNHAFAARQLDYKATSEKAISHVIWSPMREFVARVELPIQPQAP